jgi:RHS repeat-associated protein
VISRTWSATYTPFGGVHVSTGTLPTARFPGQWFQSESGLHQNWMRDYDPTTGRYLQADPLGLVDGASMYGYVGQKPLMYIDPTGEFGLLGGALGAGTNFGLQFILNYYYYRDWRTAVRCIDWWNVWTSAIYGSVGLGPRSLYKTGQQRHIPAAQVITRTSQKLHNITIGDECECRIPPERKLPDFWELLLKGSFL